MTTALQGVPCIGYPSSFPTARLTNGPKSLLKNGIVLHGSPLLMHRPGIASISGDKVYLNGTTLEEVRKYHRDTLKLALQETNQHVAEYEQYKGIKDERARQRVEEHERIVREQASNIRFDD